MRVYIIIILVASNAILSIMTASEEENDYIKQFEKLWQEVEAEGKSSATQTNHQLGKRLKEGNRTYNLNEELRKQTETLLNRISELEADKNEELSKQIDILRVQVSELIDSNEDLRKQIESQSRNRRMDKNDVLTKQTDTLRRRISELIRNEEVKIEDTSTRIFNELQSEKIE